MGNHTIYVAAAGDSRGDACLQIYDTETDGTPGGSSDHEDGQGVRKRLRLGHAHKVYWTTAPGTSGTLHVDWAGASITIPLFDQDTGTVRAEIPRTASAGRYKYTITLTPNGGSPISEDPQIVIDSSGSTMPLEVEVVEEITVVEEVRK